jgi:hypothetical protein
MSSGEFAYLILSLVAFASFGLILAWTVATTSKA